MNFKIEQCIISSCNASNNPDNKTLYLDILTADGGAFKMSVTGLNASDVPVLDKVSITGIAKGFVYGFGKQSNQKLNASNLKIVKL